LEALLPPLQAGFSSVNPAQQVPFPATSFLPPGFRSAIAGPKRIFTKYGLNQPKGHF
jgi:hypothetical protein